MSDDLLTADTLDEIGAVMGVSPPAEPEPAVKELLPVIIPFQEHYLESPRNRRPSLAVRAWRAIAACFGFRR